MLGFATLMSDMMVPPEMEEYKPIDFAGLEPAVMDMGGMFIPTYDNGGLTNEHGLAMLQKGETVIPKTRNMLDGGGITLNIHGDVYDSENFAEKIAQVLPRALRSNNDTGGL